MGRRLSRQPYRGVIYGRQSKTRTGSESLDTQEVACRETAAHFGVEVVKVLLEPPSTSAFKDRGRTRQRFAELLDMISTGQANVVVAYKTDRLSRGGGPGWSPLLEAAETAGIDLDHVVLIAGSGFLNEFELGIRATMDREESKKAQDRLRDMKTRHAAEGRPNGGERPFGFEYRNGDGLVVVVDEADMLRDAARRHLAGESLRSICTAWNEAGSLTVGGGQWRVSTLRRLLTRPMVAGLREHDGELIRAKWQPILDRETWGILRRLTEDRRTKHRPRRYPLSGILRCGKCGAGLVSATRGGTGSREKKRTYVCDPQPTQDGQRGCRGVGIRAEETDKAVEEMLFDTLDSSEFVAARTALRQQNDGEAQKASLLKAVETDEAKLIEYFDLFDSGAITRTEWLDRRVKVETRVHANRRALAKHEDEDVFGDLLGPGLRDKWPDLAVGRKQALLGAVFDRLVVHPARPGANRFDPERIEPIWRA